MSFYQKKPLVIQARQFDGTTDNGQSLFEWMMDCGMKPFEDIFAGPDGLKVKTLEGVMTVNPGDWLIKGIEGEFYPCKDSIFKATYDKL